MAKNIAKRAKNDYLCIIKRGRMEQSLAEMNN